MGRYEWSNDTINRSHIHPEDIFSQEYSLAEAFIHEFCKEKTGQNFQGFKGSECLFEKWGFRYHIIPETWGLYIDNLPSRAIIHQYYSESPLAEFRASPEYQAAAYQNRKDLWENLLEWIEGRIIRYLGKQKASITDTGSKFQGWIDTLKKSQLIGELGWSDCFHPITENPLAQKSDVVCAIDVLQRQYQPAEFLNRISSMLNPEGLLLLTCRAGTGIDIFTLKDKCKTIFPLDHIYLPSPAGIKKLLEDTGFNCLEISTPGLLDVDVVNEQKSEIDKEQYLQRYIFDQFDAGDLERFQTFLQRSNLSSYMYIVAKKSGDV